jgi:hypothetical protein
MRFCRLAPEEIGLVAVFTALYAVLAFLPMFQLIGFFGKTITAAIILAPIIGIILGPYVGSLSAFLGGTIGFAFSPFFTLPSLVSGVTISLCAALLYSGKRKHCIAIYLLLLLTFGFYLPIGPAWLYPQMMWFQMVGLAILVSPLQSTAIRHLKSGNIAKAFYALLVTFLTSTLAGQIAGSLVFEATFWPLLIPTIEGWKANWMLLTFIYPLERITLAVLSMLIGAPLLKVLRSANLMPSSHLEDKRAV